MDPSHIIVVTNATYAPIVRQQLPELADSQILLEPCRRNTAPCIAWAVRHIRACDPQASMIVTPSDHLITNERWFGAPGFLKVKTFVEKPDIELARVFVDSGEFYWNSGIFLWSAKSISRAFSTLAPDLDREFDKGEGLFGTPRENEFITEHFPSCPSISVDFAIMEKASNVYVECANFGWSDLGTWSALYDNSPKNRETNVTQNCNVITYDSTGNIFAVRQPDKLVVAAALTDYIVADSGDVLLICPKEREQDIKRMVNDVQERFDDKYL